MSLFENIGKKTESRFDKNNLFINRNQLNYDGSDLLEKIPSLCGVCKDNRVYQILIIKIQELASYGSAGIELKYMVKCTNCGEVYNILDTDYSIIKPFVKLNEKLKSEKITPSEYQIKSEKHINKLAKKKKLI